VVHFGSGLVRFSKKMKIESQMTGGIMARIIPIGDMFDNILVISTTQL
jgi:hypothetical protein